MVSPILNDCLKLFIDGQVKPHLVPKLLLQVLIIELNKSIASPSEEGVLKESRDADSNIIISDSTPLNILPPQLKNMTS